VKIDKAQLFFYYYEKNKENIIKLKKMVI